jgi:hypothetical protein
VETIEPAVVKKTAFECMSGEQTGFGSYGISLSLSFTLSHKTEKEEL